MPRSHRKKPVPKILGMPKNIFIAVIIIVVVGIVIITTTILLTKKSAATGATGKYNVTIKQNSPTGSKTTTLSPPGTSSSGSSGSSTSQVNCPIGEYKLNDVCTPCPDFKTTDSAGATSVNQCTKCLPGYDMVNEKCVVPAYCNIGYYKSNGVCVACPPNKTTRVAGAVSIDSCECMAGYATNSATKACECPANTFYDPLTPNAVKCFPCKTNTVSTQGLNRECSCINSSFTKSPEGACYCAKGTYLNDQGSACVACPSNQTTLEPNSQGLNSCICPLGTTKNVITGECACGIKQYYDPVIEKCAECPPGKTIREDGGGCVDICPSGFFIDANSWICKPCEAGTANPLSNQVYNLSCPSCGPGQYSGPRAQSCATCSGANVYMGSPAGTGPDDCLCLPRFYRDTIRGECLPCPFPTTNSRPGAINSIECDQCVTGYFKNSSGQCVNR